MINFSLPRSDFNTFIFNLNRKNFLKENFGFNMEIINIPWNSWDGGAFNINQDAKLMLNEDFNNMFMHGGPFSFRIDLSSIYIDETQFTNRYANLILEKGQNGSTVLEISNLKLYDYIKQHYPNYFNFILSPNAWLMADITPEMLNVILNQDDIILASLPFYLNDNIDYLNAIEKKSKIELSINDFCGKCKNFVECRKQEILNIYDYSENSVIKTCPFINTEKTISLQEIKEQYLSKGIYNFKITPSLDAKNHIIFLIKFFVKEDCQKKVLIDAFNMK